MIKILTSIGMILGYGLTVVGFWKSEEDKKRALWWSLGMLVGVRVHAEPRIEPQQRHTRPPVRATTQHLALELGRKAGGRLPRPVVGVDEELFHGPLLGLERRARLLPV